MIRIDSDISQLDQFDRKMLSILSVEGRISVTDLAERIGLSATPCRVRLNRLQKEGFILGFKAQLNPAQLRREQIAFVEVKLKDTTEGALQAFNAAVQAVPQIEQCHMIAGAFDYLLKVRTRDMRSYRDVLGEVISALPHVASSSTHVSMQSVKDELAGG